MMMFSMMMMLLSIWSICNKKAKSWLFHSKIQNKCSSIWYKYLYSLFSLLTESSIICGCVWTIGHILWLFISSFNTTHIIHYNSIKFSVWRMDTYKQFCCFFIHLSEYCQQFMYSYLYTTCHFRLTGRNFTITMRENVPQFYACSDLTRIPKKIIYYISSYEWTIQFQQYCGERARRGDKICYFPPG